MPWSSALPQPASRIALYAAAVMLFGFEAVVAWLILHPAVPPNYRAYYIDHSTTCLDQPVTGAYRWGTTLNLADAAEAADVRVCGWEGPAGDGLHAVGTSSRLRLAATPSPSPLVLRAELSAVTPDGVPSKQRVEVLVDGEQLATWVVDAKTPEVFTVEIPNSAAADGKLEIAFDYPDALRIGPTDPDTRWRSVKLLTLEAAPR